MASNFGNFNTNITGQGSGGAIDALGLGSDLSRQVQDETDEERKRRLRLMQQQTGTGSALGAVGDLFGKSALAGTGMGVFGGRF